MSGEWDGGNVSLPMSVAVIERLVGGKDAGAKELSGEGGQDGAMLPVVTFPDSVSFCCNNPMLCVM